jgi:uncharacterized protein (UPF0248 family)
MMPIHQLLARIRHDPNFGAGEFEIGYRDRFETSVQRIALAEIMFPEEPKRTLQVVDADGKKRRIPFHRVRAVWKDGELIWHRP